MSSAHSTAERRHRGAFTLVEVLVTIVCLSIMAGVTLPVLHGATSIYAESKRAQRASGQLGYALERLVRAVREIDEDEDTGALALDALDTAALRLAGGASYELVGDRLTRTEPGAPSGPICTGVDRFELRYFDQTGVQTADPEAVHVIQIEIERDGVVLTTRAFPRVRAT